MEEIAALAAVIVVKPARAPAPVFNAGPVAAVVASFLTIRCHFFRR
jgi:hypothetical protein